MSRKPSKKARSLQQEIRAFQSDWEEKYFQIEIDNKAHCLLCHAVISGVKSFNVERHYKIHSAKYNCYRGESRKRKLETLKSRNVEAVIFQPLPLPLTKNNKTTVDNFFNFCGSVAFLLHFIILKRQKPSFIAITLPTSLDLIVPNYSMFLFLRHKNSC